MRDWLVRARGTHEFRLFVVILIVGAAIGAFSPGFLTLQNLFAQHMVHKTVLTLAAWVVFAVLLGGRHWLGWRGTTAVRFTLWGFALLLLGFYGSKVVLELILHKPV